MSGAARLDRDYARRQFPAFAEPSLSGQAFFENAGGSYACGPVIARLGDYYRRLKVQPYYPSAASIEAGEWMDASHERLAEYLNVGADEIHFGPSTSQNTYVLAQALRPLLKAGDELIVSSQDHEANNGAFRRLTAHGITVKEWRADRDSGALNPADLDRLFSERTRLLAFTHCSNIVAHINPVRQITERARRAGVITVVDGVAFAPHGLPDVTALGADIYLFSLYKTFGPHQGLMVVRRDLLDRLGNEGHFFNDAYTRKRLTPAGPDHAQIAAARGVAEYFDALDAHHAAPGASAGDRRSLLDTPAGGKGADGRAQRVRELLRGAEMELLPQLLDYLAQRKDLRLLGPADAAQRAATVAFVPLALEPREVAVRLARLGVMAAAGNFYAPRLLEAMGVDAQRGALRLSFVHYTSAQEMQHLLQALDQVMTHH